MKKSISYIIGIGSLMCSSCDDKKPAQTPPTPVNYITAKVQSVVYYNRYEATTVALSQVNLLPQVPGYITSISFKEGSHVEKGTELYNIDKRLYEANYAQAVANLQVAQGNLTQAQQDAERYTYLMNADAVAKQTYDHALITLENAKSSVKAAEDAVKTAKTNLDYSVITAPFDGTIGFSQVKIGDFVNTGQTILNTISTDDPMGVDFLINEKELPHFEDIQTEAKEMKKGKNDTAKQSDSLFTLILPNGAIYEHLGELSVIDRAVDPQTGTIRVRLVFANPKFYLRAGMSCVSRVHNLDVQPQIVIPSKATIEQMGEYFVYIVKDTAMSVTKSADTSAKGRANTPKVSGLFAFEKKVKLGATIGPNVIVKSGIEEGDKVITEGIQSLHDGAQVKGQMK